MGLFSKIKDVFGNKNNHEIKEEIKNYDKGLAKSRQEFVSQLANLSKKYKNIDDDYFEELENILIMADIGVNTVMTFVDRLKDRVRSEKITDSNVLKEIIVDELFVMYVGNNIIDSKIHLCDEGPTVILFVGVNGVGKTTTIGKIASMYQNQGKKVMLVAGDTFRAGAIEQLEEWGKKTNTLVFSNGSKDPSAVIYEAIELAKKENYDMVMVDTAGRLQIDEKLMEELKDMSNEIKPHEILLVIDAMMGQDAINVITGFNDALNLTGVILTKLDGDTRGGAALSIRHLTNVPIKFIGISEKMDGLDEFHPDRMATRILGMGDIMTMIEKAEEVIDQDEAEKTARRMQEGKFDLEDFLSAMKQVKKLGPLENLLKMMPGMPKEARNLKVDPKDMAHIEAIILSMTPYERRHPECLKNSRKQRISKGCARPVEEINRLIKQFEEMKKMMKQFKNGKMPF